MSNIAYPIEHFETKSFEISVASLYVRGVKPQAQGCCPHCESIIYSKRHKLCGVCGKELPAACRFTHEEVRRIETLLAEERHRHRTWLRRSNFAC